MLRHSGFAFTLKNVKKNGISSKELKGTGFAPSLHLLN